MNPTFLFKKWLKLKLSAFFTSYLGPSANAILVQLPDMRLLVPLSDLSLARHLGQKKTYSQPLIDFLLDQITSQSSVLFVGTHIGSVLIPVAKKAQRVVGIEANPATFEILQQNLLLNGLRNTQLYNRAAFDQKTELEFLASPDNTGGSKVAFQGTTDVLFRYDGSQRIKVQGDRVDALLTERKFDLIVMDIEGSEHKALQGMPETLSNCNKLVLEVLPISITKVAQITPEEFFNAIPARFHTAKPIDAAHLDKSYSRENFLKMYDAIVRNDALIGTDVLFEAS